jgi:hypothetical protein
MNTDRAALYMWSGSEVLDPASQVLSPAIR